MQLLEAIQTRRSVRAFSDRPIPPAVFEQIVAAAAWAPSWKNTQIARYNVLQSRPLIEQLARECVMGFAPNAKVMQNAAALVLLSIVTGRSGFERNGSFSTAKGDGWQMFDAGIAAQTFCLAAHDCGLGAVILGIFDEAKVAQVVALPENEQLAAIIAVGYPAAEPPAPPRKPVETLLRML